MTRKQALNRALQVLDDEEAKNKIKEILNEMPFTHWSEQTIFDTINQFIFDNNRIPNSKDFKKCNKMPPHPVIKLRFKMTIGEFLKQYYFKTKSGKSPYSVKTKEEWKDYFVLQYKTKKPASEEYYNRTRDKKTPTWNTIAKMFGITKWNDWLKFCNIIDLKKNSMNSEIVISNEVNFVKK